MVSLATTSDQKNFSSMQTLATAKNRERIYYRTERPNQDNAAIHKQASTDPTTKHYGTSDTNLLNRKKNSNACYHWLAKKRLPVGLSADPGCQGFEDNIKPGS